MKYRLSILSLSALLFIAGCIIYLLFNYAKLSDGEGWGMVYMISLIVFASTSLIIDFVIQLLIKDRIKQFLLATIVLAGYLILFFIER